MPNRRPRPALQDILIESSQGHETRVPLFRDLEKRLGVPVVTFFTSFTQPVMMEDADADMLGGILQSMVLDKGLALIVSSPGGSALAAERIINICRSYSGLGEYMAVVPGKAKSAATMVCFGANKIVMGPTSELGAIDPQVTIPDPERRIAKRFSVYNIVESYDDLFRRAVQEKGNLQPYLQQLANYDEREIKEYRSALLLSEDIAERALGSGMMRGVSDIKQRIEVFLSPKSTKTHGRPIYPKDAEACGLIVEHRKVSEPVWQAVQELHVRTNHYVSVHVSKCIESRDHSCIAPRIKE